MLIALTIGLIAIVCTALIHYATMMRITRGSRLSDASPILRFVVMILTVSVVHLVEAGVWAVALGIEIDLGALQGQSQIRASDVLGFSLVNFATLGLGVLTPTENLKFIAALGALNGFLLITCSASFIHRSVSALSTATHRKSP